MPLCVHLIFGSPHNDYSFDYCAIKPRKVEQKKNKRIKESDNANDTDDFYGNEEKQNMKDKDYCFSLRYVTLYKINIAV